MSWTSDLIDQTNIISSEVGRFSGPNDRTFNRAIQASCKTMHGLLVDPSFAHFVETSHYDVARSQNSINKFIKDKIALRRFLDLEENILVEAGLNESLVRKAMADIQQHIEYIGSDQVNIDMFFHRLLTLKYAICRLRTSSSKRSLKSEYPLYEIVLGCTGIITTAVNASALAISVFGFNTIAQALSQAIGAVLLGLGGDQLKRQSSQS